MKTKVERQREAVRSYREKNREKLREYSRKLYKDRTKSFEGYARILSDSAKKRTKDSDVTEEFILSLPKVCAISGREFEYKNRYNTFSNPLAPSLDRIDSSKGYYKNNVQLTLNCINKMKNDMNNEDFKKLWKEFTK